MQHISVMTKVQTNAKVSMLHIKTQSVILYEHLCTIEHGSYISLVNKLVNNVHDIFSQLFIIFLKRQKSEAIYKVKLTEMEEISIHRKQNCLQCETMLYHHPICRYQFQLPTEPRNQRRMPEHFQPQFDQAVYKQERCIINLIN